MTGRPQSRRAARLAALGLCNVLAGPAVAQQPGALPVPGAGYPDFPIARPQTPVLTLDQDRLFAESAFGRRVSAEIDAASEALAAENREIEAELLAEERDLTERRAEMPPEDFRALAEAFDEKAVGFRRRQDAKARALQRRDEAERAAFFRAVSPILSDLVAELGAVAILDDRAVLFAAPSIDVTDRAIARIDARIGAGEALSPDGPVLPENPSLDAQRGPSDDGGADTGPTGLLPGGDGAGPGTPE
jgi:Skp family chaperone for outer membrane proteins